MSVLASVVDALAMAGSMTWQIGWSLIFGFTLSAVVQAVVRREAITRMLGDDRPPPSRRPPGSGSPRRRAPTPRSRSRGPCSARAPASPPRWSSSSPPRTWSSSSASSWPCCWAGSSPSRSSSADPSSSCWSRWSSGSSSVSGSSMLPASKPTRVWPVPWRGTRRWSPEGTPSRSSSVLSAGAGPRPGPHG